jgi:hypothetical protein
MKGYDKSSNTCQRHCVNVGDKGFVYGPFLSIVLTNNLLFAKMSAARCLDLKCCGRRMQKENGHNDKK